MKRVLEEEVMDTVSESIAYDAMDFSEVNTAFAREVIATGPKENALLLDAGTGPGRIPVLICQMQPNWQIVAIDMAQSMLQIAVQHVVQASLQNQIRLELVDAKRLPYADGHFDMVFSNSLVHHLPDPLPFLQELKRVLKPQGGIFLRDLLRPVDEATINALVDSIGTDYDQRKLFRDSLYAALTLDEVEQLINQAGLEGLDIFQSSDRHWTAKRTPSNT
jgi:ubiquinone/menaquinone biosynthesis C-methylase UbiE